MELIVHTCFIAIKVILDFLGILYFDRVSTSHSFTVHVHAD
jgi:hypothetical protein